MSCGWMKRTWIWKLSFLYWRDVSNYMCIPGNDAHHIFCSCFSLSKCRCQDMSHQPSSWWQHPAEVHLNHILCRCSISSNIHQCVCVCQFHPLGKPFRNHVYRTSNYLIPKAATLISIIIHQLEMYRWFERNR